MDRVHASELLIGLEGRSPTETHRLMETPQTPNPTRIAFTQMANLAQQLQVKRDYRINDRTKDE